MKSGAYILVGVVFGAGVGSTVTYFGLKKKLESRHNKDLEREIAELRAYYDKKEAKRAKKEAKEDQIDSNFDELRAKKADKTPDKEVKEEERSEVVKNLDKKVTKYSSFYSDDGIHFKNLDPGGPSDGDESELEDEEDLTDGQSSLNYMRKEAYERGIEVISEDEFIERDGYEAKDCFYYVRSETLVDENDDILDGFVDYVGHEWLNYIENKPGSVVYVKNNHTSTKYMITAVEGDYIYE